MYNLITVKTFTYPHELAIIQGRLESEGIECFVLDELTAQVNPFYSNAIGGIKLQVKESDLERTIEILKDGGYINEGETQPSKIYLQLEKATSGIPFINKLRLEFRVIAIIVFGISLISGIYFIATMPSTFELLTNDTWCVDSLAYKGKNYFPNTVSAIQFKGSGFCKERISFRKIILLQCPDLILMNQLQIGNLKMIH